MITHFKFIRLKRNIEMRLDIITAVSFKRNIVCHEDGGKHSSETLVCTVVNGIVFHKAVDFMSCKVMCLRLSRTKIICSALSSAWSNVHVKFEVLIAVTMKNAVFWDMIPCSHIEIYWHIRGTCCCHLQKTRRRQHISSKFSLGYTALFAWRWRISTNNLVFICYRKLIDWYIN
jgi:hypothetical protein